MRPADGRGSILGDVSPAGGELMSVLLDTKSIAATDYLGPQLASGSLRTAAVRGNGHDLGVDAHGHTVAYMKSNKPRVFPFPESGAESHSVISFRDRASSVSSQTGVYHISDTTVRYWTLRGEPPGCRARHSPLKRRAL